MGDKKKKQTMSATKRFLELTSSQFGMTTDEYYDEYYATQYKELAMQKGYEDYIKQAEDFWLEDEYNEYMYAIELSEREYIMLYSL